MARYCDPLDMEEDEENLNLSLSLCSVRLFNWSNVREKQGAQRYVSPPEEFDFFWPSLNLFVMGYTCEDIVSPHRPVAPQGHPLQASVASISMATIERSAQPTNQNVR